ncbi:MAG: Hint domain-containing protein [Methyloprofundus sp.]|nr:Hint domain-containing protein [Methyloprofundus sp.]
MATISAEKYLDITDGVIETVNPGGIFEFIRLVYTGISGVDNTDVDNLIDDVTGNNVADPEVDTFTVGGVAYTFNGFYLQPEGPAGPLYAVYGDSGGNMYVPYNGTVLDDPESIDLIASPITTHTDGNALNDTMMLCFVAGTAVLTAESGYVAVESLKIGDELLVANGESHKIKFIFRRSVALPRLYFDKSLIMPVRILQGALGADLPSADLLVSPSHALFIDGNLVEAHALINGSSIYQETSWEGELTYYHIEMENHDIIYAENTATETFIDNASRVTFDNYDEYKELYGEEQDMLELEYPRAKSSRQLPRALKQKLLDRVAILYPELIDKEVA